MENTYTWTNIYQELANKVLEYKPDRIGFLKLVEKSYKDAGMEYKLFWNEHYFTDIDPFTFFGTFNRGIKHERRVALLKAYKENLGLVSEIPTDFLGIPVLNNMQSWFMDDSPGEQMDTYWELFETSIKRADTNDSALDDNLEKLFDKAVSFGGTRWNITMALFWVRPFAYINLDSNNRVKLKEQGLFDGKFPTGKQYLSLCGRLKDITGTEGFPFESFPSFSANSWEEVNKDRQAASDTVGDALADSNVRKRRYWIYTPGVQAEKWDDYYKKGIMAVRWGSLGDLNQYDSKGDVKQAMKKKINPAKSFKNGALAAWQFFHDMQIGDVVFVKKGIRKIVGRGVVESDYYFDPEVEDDYKNIRQVRWTDIGEWDHPGQAVAKMLTDVTRYTDYVERLKSLFSDSDKDIDEDEEVEKDYPPYSREEFLQQVYMDENSYDTLVSLIKTKKNVILQGAPGVGKTYAAKRLAYSIIGSRDQDRVMMVQFHQSYSYEDFIEGIRPSATGMSFDIKKGAFLEFCDTARDDLDNDYFFIIDEINRGNLSKIFGELFMLIEEDKRGNELRLLYSGDNFSVPQNVYIIGMMNTADRSLALLDYALRRRFAFYEMKPGFTTEGFRRYRDSLSSEKFNKLVSCVERLNDFIMQDESLGEGFCIGHSYFCEKKSADDKMLSNIVEFELVPMLKEYWFDDTAKVREWSEELRRSIQ